MNNCAVQCTSIGYSYYLNYRNTVDGIVDFDIKEDAIEDEMTTPVVPAIPISHVENLKDIMSEFYNVDQDKITLPQLINPNKFYPN